MNRREFVAVALASPLATAADPPPGIDTPAQIAPMAHAGYESKPATTAGEVQWVQVDLGASRTIDAVKLYPVNDYLTPDGFPVRFRIEAASEPEFTSAALIADCTAEDYASPGTEIRTFRANRVAGRYVRLTVTRLRQRKPGVFGFALAKIDALSGTRDVAESRPVSDSTSGNLGVTLLTRPPRPMGEGLHTDNPRNVIPERAWKRVPYQAEVPLSGVRLDGGVLKTALENNVAYLLNSWTFDELVREFRDRAGKPNPAGLRKQEPFWERDLAGSNAARFLMGAGNAVRWTDHPELRDRMNRIVDLIAECRQPNGYIMAYPEDSIFYSERGGYARAWLTHGLIEAGYAGNPQAFQLLRGYYDWFDGCKYLPELLRGAAQGVQGMIGNARMYFTPAGKAEDMQVVQRYFQENYWLEQLARREDRAIWLYPYDRPHCYLITDLEAYLDLYRATGSRKYLDAALGGWDLYHDKWEHVGGTIAICEFQSYPPRSYRLYGETGELCGNVFWALFNQRLHRLYPDQEKYVNEIEKSIYNAALANQAGSRGIIYHAKLAGKKGDADTGWAIYVNTCCAGQGTRLLGSLPEYIYSLTPDGLLVNLFAASTITWKQAGQPIEAKMITEFPFQPNVELRISAPQPVRANIRVRVPAWASAEMPILVNGKPASQGRPGSYAMLDRIWSEGDTISFVLPMSFRLTRYAGQEKLKDAYALEYGPILMALIGNVDEKQGAAIHARADDLPARLRAKAGQPLHFAIDGDEQHEYIPYWQVSLDQTFTCYPTMNA